MKRVLGLLLALSLGLNLGLLYMQYQGPPEGRREGPPGLRSGPGPRRGPQGQPRQPGATGRMIDAHVDGLTRHVGLDDQQQVALRQVLEANMPALQSALAGGAEANEAMSRAFGAADFDPEMFRRLVKAAALARNEIDSLSGIMLLGEAAILTPEQRQSYAKVAPTIHTGAGPSGPPPPPRR